MAMNWFWRMVCSPDCTDACQVNCPGCHSLADEWAEQGYTTAVTGGNAKRGRWRDFRYAWSCWSRSASARMLGRLDPTRRFRRGAADPAAATAGCGCHPGTATAGTGADAIRGEVRRYYDLKARGTVADRLGDPCCTPALPTEVSAVPQYREEDLGAVPTDAIMASLGCGNPFLRANLRPGEVVLDLGSGAGMDSLVAARQVGAQGHVFGLDSSDEMLRRAQGNAASAGAGNVAFLKGDMESIPLPRESVDVIISNCVVTLVPDKAKALREAYRVLRPGGRVSISDIVTTSPVPDQLRGNLSAWAACVGGALSVTEYHTHLAAAGFEDIEIERDREYDATDAELAGLTSILASSGLSGVIALGFANTSVRARRPATVPAAPGTGIPVPAGQQERQEVRA